MSDVFPLGPDFRAARLLMGLTLAKMAELAGVSSLTLSRIEASGVVKPVTFMAVYRPMRARGVRFGEVPGDVTLEDRRAPTVEAVGVMTGQRMKRARMALRLNAFALTMHSTVPRSQINKLEALARCDEGISELHFYQVFAAVERLGYRFGKAGGDDGLVHPRCPKCVQLHPKGEACA